MRKKAWYVLYTRSKWEKKCAESIKENGYEVYLPLIKTLKQWSDRKKMIEIPLISGYLFVKIYNKDSYKILDTLGIVGFVKFGGNPALIRDSQINALKKAINNNLIIESINKTFEKGQKVKIISGPMKGAEGEYVTKAHKTNFIINMSNIGYSLKIEINAQDVMEL